MSDYTAVLAGVVILAGGLALVDKYFLKGRRSVGANGQSAEPS
jgi:hypothetical protein